MHDSTYCIALFLNREIFKLKFFKMDSLLEFQGIHCKIIWLIFLPPPGKNILSFFNSVFSLVMSRVGVTYYRDT